MKITSIESALTWVQKEAQVTLPTVPVDLFTSGNTKSLVRGSTSPVNESTLTNATERILQTLVEEWRKSIKFETIVASCLLGAWLLVAGIGFGRLLITCLRLCLGRRGIQRPRIQIIHMSNI